MLDDIASREEILAVAVLVAGVVLARLASTAVSAILGALDRRAARLSTSSDSLLSPRFIRVTRAVVFWLMLILAVSIALRLVQVGGIGEALNAIIDFVPQLLVGFMIVVASHVLGLIVSHVAAEVTDQGSADAIGPRLLHVSLVTIGVVMALQYLGVNVTFVTQLLLVLVGIIGAGLMLAFSLGARRHVANLLARRELSRFAIGDRIRVGDLEGGIVEIHDTGLDLDTPDGIASVPAFLLAESVVVRLPRDESSE